MQRVIQYCIMEISLFNLRQQKPVFKSFILFSPLISNTHVCVHVRVCACVCMGAHGLLSAFCLVREKEGGTQSG